MTPSTKWQRYSFNQDPSFNVRNWDTADRDTAKLSSNENTKPYGAFDNE